MSWNGRHPEVDRRRAQAREGRPVWDRQRLRPMTRRESMVARLRAAKRKTKP